MNSADPTNAVCRTLQGLSMIGNPCTASGIMQGSFITAYFPQNQSFCALGPALQFYGVAMQLNCCASDLCNQPGSTSAISTSKQQLLKCYYGVDSNVQLIPVNKPRFDVLVRSSDPLAYIFSNISTPRAYIFSNISISMHSLLTFHTRGGVSPSTPASSTPFLLHFLLRLTRNHAARKQRRSHAPRDRRAGPRAARRGAARLRLRQSAVGSLPSQYPRPSQLPAPGGARLSCRQADDGK